jgi:predicted Zn-dependent protease
LAPFFWESNQYEKEKGLTLVTNDQNLLRYWLGIYSSYALTGTNILTPFKPVNQREITLAAQVTRAMELFSIAHEYGHHYLGHGRDILADQRTEEFEADRFALRISNEIEKKSGQLYNPYLPSGAGAIILFRSLETLNRLRHLYNEEKMEDAGTHPNADARIDKFARISIIKPFEFNTYLNFRIASNRIMQCVASLVEEVTAKIPIEDRRKMMIAALS